MKRCTRGEARRAACAGGDPPAGAGLQDGQGAALEIVPGGVDRFHAGPHDRRPQLSPARSPRSGPRVASAAGAQERRRAHALSLSGKALAHAGLPPLQDACHPPKRTQDEKAQAGGRRRSPRRRRHAAGPHTPTSEAAPDRRAAPHRAAPPCRPLRPPRRRPPPGLPYPRVPAIGRKQTSLPGDASAGHPRASTLSPIGQAGGIWPGSRLPVFQSRLS